MVIPGGGTMVDVENLASALGMTTDAVIAMMNCRGMGLRGENRDDRDDRRDDAVATTTTDGPKETTRAVAPRTTAEEGPQGKAKTRRADPVASTGAPVKSVPPYELPTLPSVVVGGVLCQTGTLDSRWVGRGAAHRPVPLPKVDLCEPARLFPSLFPKAGVSFVAAAPSACHSVVVDVDGRAWGHGRNDEGQLGRPPDERPHTVVPIRLEPPTRARVVRAAVGKSHSVLIDADGGAWAAGRNHLGQCGVNSSTTDRVNGWRRCVVLVVDGIANDKPKDATSSSGKGKKRERRETTRLADGKEVKFVMAACGEFTSFLLSDRGHLYSAGSAEFGQLGNGDTGEHFVSANKIAFANAYRFEPRTTFVCGPPDEFRRGVGSDEKTVPIFEDVRLSFVAAGRCHALAVEAPRVGDDAAPRRCFSWGRGDYGCLGHGAQADELRPRVVAALASRALRDGDRVVSVAAGAQCSLFLTRRGRVHQVGRHRSVGDAVMRPTLLEVLSNNGHVVDGVAAGPQTIACCTRSGATVSWGTGPHGELGYGPKGPRSSAKAKFVMSLDACRVSQVASGHGHTLFLVKQEDAEDEEAIGRLAVVEREDVEDFERETLLAAADEAMRKAASKRGHNANKDDDHKGATSSGKKRKKSDGAGKGKKKT